MRKKSSDGFQGSSAMNFFLSNSQTTLRGLVYETILWTIALVNSPSNMLHFEGCRVKVNFIRDGKKDAYFKWQVL